MLSPARQAKLSTKLLTNLPLRCKLLSAQPPPGNLSRIRRCFLIKKLFSNSACSFLTAACSVLTLGLIVVLLSAVNSVAQEQPTIAKDSVQVTAFTLSSYKGDFKTFSWVPKLKLRVNGPIASGSQIYAEFTVPGGGVWKFDCKTQETDKGHWWQPDEGGGRECPRG